MRYVMENLDKLIGEERTEEEDSGGPRRTGIPRKTQEGFGLHRLPQTATGCHRSLVVVPGHGRWAMAHDP